MKPVRLIALLACLPVVVGVLPTAAQTDLDDAERAADDARIERERAAADVAAARSERDAFGNRLADTLNRYQDTNHTIERLGIVLADLRHRLGVQEERVRELRARTNLRAADAYMRNVGASSAPVFIADSLAEVGLVTEVAEVQVELDAASVAELEAARADLEALRSEHDATRMQMADVRAELDRQRDDLAGLFALAGEEVVRAFDTLEEADATYQLALERLEEEQRKRRWTGSVEQWRELVAKYFPPQRVDEALRVMSCESRGNPDAKNPSSSATGLFQFLDGTWAWASVSAGWGGYSRLDPEANIAVAAWLVDYSIRTNHPGGAWGHWVCQP